MSRNGWIKLHRKLLDNPLWKDCKENQKIIMITILLMANHESNEWIFEGERYEAKPGEFITSLNSLSRETGYSVSIIRNTLDKFKKHGFLTYKSTNKNRLIRVENWGKYQGDKDEDNKQDNKQLASNSQANNKQLATNKNDKNDKNNIYSASEKNSDTKTYEVFEKIWSMYPEKKGKNQVSKKSKEQIEKLGIGKMEKALQRYVDDVKKQRKQGFSSLRYKNGSTWFNSGYEDYLTEESNVTPIKKEPAKIVYVNRGYL